MSSKLILLTNYYPFYKGEEYIETEINYLSKEFNEIIVIPTMITNNMKITRKLPTNVECFKVISPQSNINKIFNLVKNMPTILFNNKFRNTVLKDANSLNPFKLFFNIYFEARSLELYNRIIQEKKLIELVDKESNKIVIYSYWFYVTANLAIKVKYDFFKSNDIKIYSRGHGYDVNSHLRPFNFLPYRNYMLQNVDMLYPVSDNTTFTYQKNYEKFKDKIETKRLGVVKNIKKFPSRELFEIVSCSTVRDLKRIDIIIEVMRILEQKNYIIKWTHIGTGPTFEKMKKLANKRLRESTYHFKGAISNDQVSQFYNRNDINLFINTSESEGVPVSIMEAMSHSIPAIASNVGGTNEIVLQDINGYLIENLNDIDNISSIIEKIILLSDEDYNELCENSYNNWKKNWNADKLYSEFAKNIKEF